MKLTKYQLFNDFFKQYRKAKLLIGIDSSMADADDFLQAFKTTDHILVFYKNSQELEKAIKSFNDNIAIVLTNTNLDIQCIKNDQRLFLFQSQEKSMKINFVCKIEKVSICSFIQKYLLSDCFISYVSLNNTLYVNASAVNGFGLFTRNFIKKDTKLFTLTGEIVDQAYLKAADFHGEWNALGNNSFLIRHQRTSYGFINHSRTPNCKIERSSMTIVAITEIRENEEILLDYRKEPLPNDYINGFGKTYL